MSIKDDDTTGGSGGSGGKGGKSGMARFSTALKATLGTTLMGMLSLITLDKVVERCTYSFVAVSLLWLTLQ